MTFTFVVTATNTAEATSSDGIDFINKDNTWSILFALLKHVANTRGSDSHKHFNKIGSTNRKEGDIGFTSHRFSK